MEPWLDSEGDLARLLDSQGAMVEKLLEVAEEEGEDGTVGYIPPYGKLLDPNTCPVKDLPYLGQFVGVEVPSGASEAEARAAVKAEAGLERGTLASLRTAIKSVLGTAPFAIQERTSEGGAEAAYHFNVIVGTGKSSQALYNAINAVIPAGIWYSIVEGTGMWLQATKKWSEVTAGKTFNTIKEGEY